MKHMADLCSGLGGASQAFVLSPNWTVERLENNPDLASIPHTRPADVTLRPTLLQQPYYIHASPPCYEFSLAFNAPRGKASREGNLDDYSPDLSIVQACMDIIKDHQPIYWSLENVVGSIRYLEPLLGPPRIIIGPWVFWGNFPLPSFNNDELSAMLEEHKKTDVWKIDDPLRANHRAKMPLLLSRKLMEAIDYQTTLGLW